VKSVSREVQLLAINSCRDDGSVGKLLKLVSDKSNSSKEDKWTMLFPTNSRFIQPLSERKVSFFFCQIDDGNGHIFVSAKFNFIISFDVTESSSREKQRSAIRVWGDFE